MSKKGENIYVRKDGRWEGRYIKGKTKNGKSSYGYVYAHSYRDIKRKLNAQKTSVCRFIPERVEMEPVKPCYVLFGSILADWLDSRRYQIKESTYMKYLNMVCRYILPELGELDWNSLSRNVFESYCRGLMTCGGENGTGLSAKTVSDVMSVIRSVFRYASAHGYRLPCDISCISVKQMPRELRILSRGEQEQLCRYLYANMEPRNLGILICLFTGLRVGEICALKWEDISQGEQTIYVHQTMQRIQTGIDGVRQTKILLSSPKSPSSVRRIPIVDELMRILARYQKGSEGYVLTGREDSYIEPRNMQRHFERVLQNAGLETVNFHVLRHTFATRCVEMNFDVKSLSEILGHANVNITMNRYVHPSMDLKKANMQRLSELLRNF